MVVRESGGLRPGAGDDLRRVFQAHRPGHTGRRDLADTVADDPVRDDPPRFPERGQPDLEAELNCPIRRGIPDSRRGLVRHELGGRRPPEMRPQLASQRSIAARKAGSRSNNARPAPRQRPPTPGKTNTTGATTREPSPLHEAPCGSSRRKASRASTASSRPETTIASRWSMCPRRRRPCRPRRGGQARGNRRTVAERASARSQRAAGSAPRAGSDVSSGSAPSGTGRTSTLAGASSRTRCALVPPNPNELTPAQARPSGVGPGVETALDPERQGLDATWGFGREKCRLGGIARWCKRQRRLDQAGDPRRGLEVADVRLDRAQRRTVGRGRDPRRARPRARRARWDRRAGSRCRGLRHNRPAPARCRRAGRPSAGPLPAPVGWGPSGRWSDRPG